MPYVPETHDLQIILGLFKAALSGGFFILHFFLPTAMRLLSQGINSTAHRPE